MDDKCTICGKKLMHYDLIDREFCEACWEREL